MAIDVLLVSKDPSFWNFELLKNRPPPLLKTTLLGNRGAWSRFPSLVVLNLRILVYGFVVREKNKSVFGGGKSEKTSYTHTHISFRGESFCPSSLSEERPSGNLCYSVPGKMLYTTIPYNYVAIDDKIKA
jgi:hypothetical protein